LLLRAAGGSSIDLRGLVAKVMPDVMLGLSSKVLIARVTL